MDRLTHIFNLRRNSERKLLSSEKVRAAILDAYDCTCQFCYSQKANAVDHIIPLNPKDDDLEKIANMPIWLPEETLDCLDNLTAACNPCNTQKSNKILSESKIAALLEEAKNRKKLIIVTLNGLIPRSGPAGEYLSKSQIEQLLLTQELQATIDGPWQRKSGRHSFYYHPPEGMEERADELIAKGADIYALGWTGFFWASNHGKKSIVEKFIAGGRHKDLYHDIFDLAVYRGYPEIAELFLDIPKNKNKRRLNKLYDITLERRKKGEKYFKNDHYKILEILSDLGAEPAFKRAPEENPYIHPNDNLEVMLKVISEKDLRLREAKVKTFSRRKPDHLAICLSRLLEKNTLTQDDLEIALILLKKGADISDISADDIYRLTEAAINLDADFKLQGHAETVNLLFKNYPECLTRHLSTILNQDEFSSDDVRIAYTLLKKGATISTDSYEGMNRLIRFTAKDNKLSDMSYDLMVMIPDSYPMEESFESFDIQ